ncbi:MAG: Rid family hydrolase [Acidobacteriota bacterium]
MPFTRKLAVGAILLLAALQLYRPDRTNPPIEPTLAFDSGEGVPADVSAIVKRSCFDCHSNATRWPWYSQVAPVSWMVANHVREGRSALNFSEWRTYDTRRQARRLEEVCEIVRAGEMPPPSYLLMHGDARVSESDVRALCGWAAADADAMTSSGRTLPPFAPAAAHGDFIYVSGILPGPADGDTIESQATHVVAELSKRLVRLGTNLDRVVATSVYLKRAEDFAGLNEVWRRTWTSRPPTRTTVLAELPSSTALLQVSAVAARPGVDVEVLLPGGWQPPSNPYSYGIRAGDTVFLSGLVPRSPRDGTAIEGDIAIQTRAVLDSASALLEAAGLSFANVVSARVFIADIADFQRMNDVYRAYVSETPPARATVRATLTNPDFRIEITLMAASGSTRLVFTTPAEDGSPGQPSPNLSSAIGFGRRVFLSGMLGVRPGSGSDAVAQTGEALDRLERTMALAGVGWPNVIDSVVYVTDLSRAGLILEAMQTRAGGNLPVGAVAGAGLVSPEALVEIMLTAGK